MAPRFGDKKWLWIGVCAAVVVAVVCVLVFVVFADDVFGADGPEATVEKMLEAMEAKDVDALIALLDPEGLKELEAQGLSADDFKDMREQEMTYESMEFSDIVMQTELSADGQSATVTILEGKLTVVDDGETTVQYVSDIQEPLTYELVLRDGKWYLSVAASSSS